MRGGASMREQWKHPKPKEEDKEGLTACVRRDLRRAKVVGTIPSVSCRWGEGHGGLYPTI